MELLKYSPSSLPLWASMLLLTLRPQGPGSSQSHCPSGVGETFLPKGATQIMAQKPQLAIDHTEFIYHQHLQPPGHNPGLLA